MAGAKTKPKTPARTPWENRNIVRMSQGLMLLAVNGGNVSIQRDDESYADFVIVSGAVVSPEQSDLLQTWGWDKGVGGWHFTP